MSLDAFFAPPSYSVVTALQLLGSLAGLGITHVLGDILLQSDAQAVGKAFPDDDRLHAGTHPWTGWSACLRHVRSYLAVQAAGLGFVTLFIPLPLPGLIAALALSGSTHAVIDRGWATRRVLAAKGYTTGWSEARFWVDQALHWGCLLVAAGLAARVDTFGQAAWILGAGLLLIGNALYVEHLHARGVAIGHTPTDRY
jgi:hypothetical protein